MARDISKYVFNGVRYASVTEILGLDGHNDHYKDINPEVLERAAKRGVFCHEASERMDAGLLTSSEDIPKPFRGYMASYYRFCQEQKYEVLESEMVVRSHAYRFAGQLDRLCVLNGNVAILDLKTADTMSGYDSWGLQTAAYAMAYKEEFAPELTLTRYTLCLHRSGTPSLQEWSRDDDYDKFIAATKRVNEALDARTIKLPEQSIEESENECLVSMWIRRLPPVPRAA